MLENNHYRDHSTWFENNTKDEKLRLVIHQFVQLLQISKLY